MSAPRVCDCGTIEHGYHSPPRKGWACKTCIDYKPQTYWEWVYSGAYLPENWRP